MHQGVFRRNGTPAVARAGWQVKGAVKEGDEVCVGQLFRR